MEEELEDDPRLELKDEKFEKFVLDSHDDAYLGAGLLDLPCPDFAQITVTYGSDAWEKILSRKWPNLGIGLKSVGECFKQADNEKREADRKLREALRRPIEELLE